MSAWSTPVSHPKKAPTTRVQNTAGRSSSATWSVSLEVWTDHENKIDSLLDNDHPGRVSHRKRRCRANMAISGQPPWHRTRPWLPNVLFRHPRRLEGTWSHRHPRTAFSAAQGMG